MLLLAWYELLRVLPYKLSPLLRPFQNFTWLYIGTQVLVLLACPTWQNGLGGVIVLSANESVCV